MRCHWHQVILWLSLRISVTHDALCEYNGQTGIKEITFTKLDVTYIIKAIGNTSSKCQIPLRTLEERIDQMYKCTCLTEIVFSNKGSLLYVCHTSLSRGIATDTTPVDFSTLKFGALGPLSV